MNTERLLLDTTFVQALLNTAQTSVASLPRSTGQGLGVDRLHLVCRNEREQSAGSYDSGRLFSPGWLSGSDVGQLATYLWLL